MGANSRNLTQNQNAAVLSNLTQVKDELYGFVWVKHATFFSVEGPVVGHGLLQLPLIQTSSGVCGQKVHNVTKHTIRVKPLRKPVIK